MDLLLGSIRKSLHARAQHRRHSRQGCCPRVRAAAADNPDIPIRINADRATAYENVMRVIDQLQSAGFKKVGLKTLDPAESETRTP